MLTAHFVTPKLFISRSEMLSCLLEHVTSLLQEMSFILGELLSGALQVLGDMCSCIMGSSGDVSKIFVDLEVVVGVCLWLGMLKSVVYSMLSVQTFHTRQHDRRRFELLIMFTYECS